MPTSEMEMRMTMEQPEDEEAYRRAYHDGRAEGYNEGENSAKADLRQDLLAALGEEMEIGEPGVTGAFEREMAWRRGWNAFRGTMLDHINRLLPEEEK